MVLPRCHWVPTREAWRPDRSHTLDLFIAKKSDDSDKQQGMAFFCNRSYRLDLSSYYMASQALLRLFQAKKPAFGAWLTLPCNFTARTVAQASPHLSWIVIDCEHGLISLVPGAAEAVTAIQGAVPNGGGPTPIVRIPATGISASTSWQIKHALDSGARGVMVPLVNKRLTVSHYLSFYLKNLFFILGVHCRESQGGRCR